MQWIRRIGCFFGFHNYLPIREEWFLYKQQQLYIDHPDYKKHGENITAVILCTCCHKRVEIKVES